MLPFLVVLALNLSFLKAVYLYEDEENLYKPKFVTLEDVDFDPVVPLTIDKRNGPVNNINCEDFHRYALNCTLNAANIYNSSKKSPPMPAKILDWCRAIRHLTNCALDWNSECKDVTETHFNEESIKGHMHVVNSVCDDEWFLARYDILSHCLLKVSAAWEKCYFTFKNNVDTLKNSSLEWTHYSIHFQLCCARTLFRRCTLDAIFDNNETKCAKEEGLTLQKFSVIISEGDVFQNCDNHIMYSNCPGGDPRPTGSFLARMLGPDADDKGSKEKFKIKYLDTPNSQQKQIINLIHISSLVFSIILLL